MAIIACYDAEHEGNSAAHHTGKPCIETDCDKPAGTAWSPLWCVEHNMARLRRIDVGLNAIEESYARQKSKARQRAVEAMAPLDRVHVYHAWAQAEDTGEINRPHIDACVRLGFMEKLNRRRWEFTPDGKAVAEQIEALWDSGRFDNLTGAISDSSPPAISGNDPHRKETPAPPEDAE